MWFLIITLATSTHSTPFHLFLHCTFLARPERPGWIYLCPLCLHQQGWACHWLWLNFRWDLGAGLVPLFHFPTPLFSHSVRQWSPIFSSLLKPSVFLPHAHSQLMTLLPSSGGYRTINGQVPHPHHRTRPSSSVRVCSASPAGTGVNFPSFHQQYSKHGPCSWLAASASPGRWSELPILQPTLDLLNQNLWGRAWELSLQVILQHNEI